MLTLLAVELLQGVVLRGRWLAVVLLAVAACTAANIGWIIVDGRFQRRQSAVVAAELTALQISRGLIPGDFQPDRRIRLEDVRAAGYFAAIAKYRSSPADSIAELTVAPPGARAAADSVLVRALGVGLGADSGAGLPSAEGPAVESVQGGLVRRSGACLELTPTAALSALDVRLPPGGAIVRPSRSGGTIVWIRRFGPFPARPLGVVRNRSAWLRAPTGHATTPWSARLVSTHRTTVCR